MWISKFNCCQTSLTKLISENSHVFNFFLTSNFWIYSEYNLKKNSTSIYKLEMTNQYLEMQKLNVIYCITSEKNDTHMNV